MADIILTMRKIAAKPNGSSSALCRSDLEWWERSERRYASVSLLFQITCNPEIRTRMLYLMNSSHHRPHCSSLSHGCGSLFIEEDNTYILKAHHASYLCTDSQSNDMNATTNFDLKAQVN